MLLAIATTTIYLLQQPMFTLTSAFNTYSESTLQRLAQASSLSYLSLDKMSSSPYYEKCQLQPLIQVVDAESESGATIFRALPKNIDDNDNDDHESNTQKIIVACRGSANPKNFGTNLKFNLVPANRLSQNDIPEDALVHDGFQSASVGLWKELSQPLEKLLNGDDDTEIVFTGHSLGAATGERVQPSFIIQRCDFFKYMMRITLFFFTLFYYISNIHTCFLFFAICSIALRHTLQRIPQKPTPTIIIIIIIIIIITIHDRPSPPPSLFDQ